LEFACHDASNPNYTGLLRLWNFTVEDEFLVEEARRPVAERERAILGHLRVQDPGFYDNYVLRSLAHDAEFTLRYSEVFDRMPDLERLTRFAGSLTDLPIERRIELARLFLDRVAGLHRLRVAHRDLDRHSVWIDDRRSKIVLSSFGASHFPERSTIGAARSKLLAGGYRVPEDLGRSSPGTPYQQDVYLAAAVVWTLLSGARLPVDNRMPIWSAAAVATHTDVPPAFAAWFERCLATNPQHRYSDGVGAADAFADVIRKGQKVSLERQLERYRVDVDPISDYVPLEWIVSKPSRIYRAIKDGKALFVKSWPERSLGERRKSAARLIEFFARAELMQRIAADWAPRLDIACLCTDGLLLVQEWIDGRNLAQSDTLGWSLDDLRSFLSGLITAVDELHAAGLTHGDVSPNNIMLPAGGGVPRPILVDLVEFSTDEQGKATPAYCPPHDIDIRVRDRFAVCQIARELTGRLPADSVTAILSGIEKCGEGDTPWLTLKPLTEALSPSSPVAQPPSIRLSVETRRTPFEGEMLSDNGRYYVVQPRKKQSLEIFGFDQRIIVELDPADGKPRNAVAGRIDARSLSWAQNVSLFSFSGTVDVRRSQGTRLVGFEPLLELARGYEQGSASPPVDDVSAPKTPGPTVAEAAVIQFPVVQFWRETITVEEEIQPEIALVDVPKFDVEDRTLVLECEDNIGDVDVADGQSVIVSWNGVRVGDLDTARSRNSTIVIRNARNVRGLKPPAVLKLQSNDDLASFQRRSRAVARILEGRAQINNLIHYFDPQSLLAPQIMGDPVKDEDLAPYALNDDQREAFKEIWTHGPVGLLQGPPGTGKTRFIAAFTHYALTVGRLRSVLVLSQSHEAVNTAAERILQVSEKVGGQIDLLRVGSYSKISPALRKYHSRAIQDRYRELFRAGLKERVGFPARRLGLDRDYVLEALEIEAVFGSLARQIELAKNDIAAGVDPDATNAARERLVSLHDAWDALLTEHRFPKGTDPREALDQIRDEIASRHSVFDLDARRRLLRLDALGREWVSVLGARSRNLEEFMARSRNLICGTCVGIGRQGLQIDRNAFDLAIIDEAARCTPGELAVGMQSGRRILLVGDHRQLPPLYAHEHLQAIGARIGIASRKELARSDFERAFNSNYGKTVAQALKKQYRMAPKIGKLIAESFYPGQELTTERGDPPTYYKTLPAPFEDEIIWIDTGHSRSGRRETEVGTSYLNRREAAAVLAALGKIGRCEAFITAARKELKEGESLVGVVSMYGPQADHIEELLLSSDLPEEFKSLIKVDTVDGYQGKENPIVIVSLVRSNPQFSMGFVRTANRVNVALSRAMERLIIIGSARMFGADGNSLRPVVRHLGSAGRIVGDGFVNVGVTQ
jgi:serine/threonine protein kinase